MKKVGVLAVQGAFIEHENILNKIGVETFEIRQKKDLERDFDGLIIPGGESTVIGKLARELDMQDTLVKKINDGMPVFGTCAGLLVLAKKIENDDRVHLLQWILLQREMPMVDSLVHSLQKKNLGILQFL